MTPDEDPSTLYRFFTEVGIIDQLISTKLESFLPGRMTSTQFGMLGHLARRPEGETPLQLARAFQVPKTSMTHMIAGLEAAQLISLRPHASDKRSKVVQITPQGGAFLGEKMQQIGASLAPLVADLGLSPFADALPHLERIRTALDADRD
ncbi:MarR family winged helix-turn-helix transcriptional regulator [Pseudooctadecabacter sp.]|uniref:MarR family winged helix-turn-helix transcriptional regulator n=1 Tax=Pseudooctadecabacter sp. TaxID=1966338 RepID=UPI0035C79C86